jgi:hypothetical protein
MKNIETSLELFQRPVLFACVGLLKIEFKGESYKTRMLTVRTNNVSLSIFLVPTHYSASYV